MAWIDKIVMPMRRLMRQGGVWSRLFVLLLLSVLSGCSSIADSSWFSAYTGENMASYLQVRPSPVQTGWVSIYTIGQHAADITDFSRGQGSIIEDIFKASAPGWDVSYAKLTSWDDTTAIDTIRKQCAPDISKDVQSIYWLLIHNSIESGTNRYKTHYLLLDRSCQVVDEQVVFSAFEDGWDEDSYSLGRIAGSSIGINAASLVYMAHNERMKTVSVESETKAADLEKKAADEASRLAEQQRQESLRQAEQQRQQLAARVKGQPCPSREPGWFYLKGRCNKQHQPQGQGEAETDDRSWRYVGQFKAGRMVNGTFSQNGQPIFIGGMQNGRFEGKGRCAVNGAFEACEFRQGQRVDALFQQRMAQRQAQELAIRQAEAEDAANRARHEEARQQRQALAQKITECRRSAEEQSGINTTCTCDAAGEIYCNNHNKGINALLGALDGISAAAQESVDASTESLNNMIAAQRAAELQAQSEADQYGGESAPAATLSESERAAIAAQVAAQLATPQPTVTTPVATQPKPVTQSTESSASTKQPEAEPVSNNEILPEAVAVCRKNGGGYWFCDGPIQMTSVGEQGEEGLAKVRATSGCRSPRSQAGTTSDGWTIYLCGYGLDSYDRDLVSIRHLVLPRLSYNCPNAKDKDPSDHKCHQAYTTIEHY